ncbi:hypothetical protein QBC33DRAFT_513311 [Phialemonium atrogriseum]|uniref:Uncharacterized protein n=1 Tax=Phialemonium atrogriseum TaxID=1093897 RepID=A0AAJ0C3Y3_9PEZI|nr:uncharacterized protein QBC33DRAFT_513311 [Phialemonium atrogriseum]KAK1769067.1 hypothetical protein QBC33DRAFT_513311 [Phialemonium atrogriseum]
MASTPPAKENAEDIQEEERLEAALEHLKSLHLKLRALRTAIPRAIEPLSAKHSSSEELFASFVKSVTETSKELADFKEAMMSEESRKVFEQANQSRKANPKGIRPWRAVEDPDWTTIKTT